MQRLSVYFHSFNALMYYIPALTLNIIIDFEVLLCTSKYFPISKLPIYFFGFYTSLCFHIQGTKIPFFLNIPRTYFLQ